LFRPQQNKYLLLPWVVLGLMLVIGLVISIVYTAIRFYIWGDNYTATMYLVLGLIGNGKHKLLNQNILWLLFGRTKTLYCLSQIKKFIFLFPGN
jgi:hypothetical protein